VKRQGTIRCGASLNARGGGAYYFDRILWGKPNAGDPPGRTPTVVELATNRMTAKALAGKLARYASSASSQLPGELSDDPKNLAMSRAIVL
jgi:hypothetical protein